MGLLASALGNHTEAEAMFLQAYDGRCATLGLDAHDSLRSALERGRELHHLRKYTEAEAALADVETRAARVTGPGSPFALHAAQAKALAINGLGRRLEACAILRRVHGSRVTHFGERHKDTLTAAADLGELLGKARNTRNEARALLLVTCAACEETLGGENDLTVSTRDRLKAVERAIAADDGDVEEAEEDLGGGETVALLSHIYVAPNDRRRGAARAALKLLTAEAWKAGATALEALVPSAGHESRSLIALLEDAGGEETSTTVKRKGLRHVRMRVERPVVVT